MPRSHQRKRSFRLRAYQKQGRRWWKAQRWEQWILRLVVLVVALWTLNMVRRVIPLFTNPAGGTDTRTAGSKNVPTVPGMPDANGHVVPFDPLPLLTEADLGSPFAPVPKPENALPGSPFYRMPRRGRVHKHLIDQLKGKIPSSAVNGGAHETPTQKSDGVATIKSAAAPPQAVPAAPSPTTVIEEPAKAPGGEGTPLTPQTLWSFTTGALKVPSQWAKCSTEHFGPGLLQRWRGKKSLYCKGDSQFYCHEILQIKHAGPDNFCELFGAEFHPAQNGGVRLGCSQRTPGVFAGNQVVNRLLPPKYITWAPHLKFEALSKAQADFADPSDGAKTTLFVYRDCAPPYNPFHCMGDIVNAFQILQMYDLDVAAVRIIFLDPHPESNFWPMWQTLGSRLYLQKDWRSWQPVAIPHAIMVPFSGCNIIWKDFWHATFCPHPSPILLHFRRHILMRMPVPPKQAVGRFASVRPRITLLTRPKQGSRRMSNREEVRDGLKKAFPDWDVLMIDLGTLHFDVQRALMANTDILVGMHGAAIQMMLFLKSTAKLLEMHPQNSRAHLYGNMAKHLQIPYAAWEARERSPDPATTRVPVAEIVPIIKQLHATKFS